MVDATTTSLGASSASNAEQTTATLPSTSYPCNSCQITFTSSQDQRSHMKSPWHTYNIKRRVAELAPIPLQTFEAQIAKKPASSPEALSSSENESESEQSESVSPFDCLFCDQGFDISEEGFEANVEHMRSAHGMLIPDVDRVVDLQSFIEYLATEVRLWHECLYCGATKPSTEGIQSHMRDKGHCMLNLDREPELLDFWDKDDDQASEQASKPDLTDSEIRFASGKVIGSKKTTAATKKAVRKRRLAASVAKTLPTAPSDPDSSHDDDHSASEDAESSALVAGSHSRASRQLSRREEMSVAGVSPQQRQALMLAEKKAQRSEAIAQKARVWAYQQGANNQQFDQLNEGKRKWGKQNHKMLPR